MLALIAALSIAAAPAMTVVQRSRERAALSETARLLTLAQRRAVATGEPTGVAIDVDAGAITLLRLPSGSAQPVALDGPSGGPRLALHLGITFPGVRVESFVSGGAAVAPDELWFDRSGAAHGRNRADLTALGRDARLELSGDGVIVVRQVTGAVEW